jgi:hypothetical protein
MEVIALLFVGTTLVPHATEVLARREAAHERVFANGAPPRKVAIRLLLRADQLIPTRVKDTDEL